ncbi:CU044_5270 family protein [Lentzea sp. NPDC058436]|uniref:CU044_5270 family protein n=1 Tax=Lentzea sp. NPDC058436 TaxID=3346499 RepID=UPI00365BC4F5
MSEPTKPETLDRVLDAALSRAGDEPVAFDVAAGRTALATALKDRAARPVESKPRRTRWLAAAAAVTVLTGAGLAASTVDLTGGNSATAAEQLVKAADLASRVVERPVGPGQFRYVRSRYHGITVEYGSTKAWTTDAGTDEWIPADRRDEWLQKIVVGQVEWLDGHEGEGRPDGGPFKDGQEFRGKCGSYSFYAEGQPDRCTNGTFSNPTPEFVASLPKDPAAMLDRLREQGHAGDAGALMSAGEALNSGQYPAEVRATIFRALALIPGLVVTDKKANLDGKEGVALGMKYFDDFIEFIVDPENGDYIGRRETVAEDLPQEKGGLEKGTVRSSSAVTTKIVDSQGAR